MTPKSSSGYKKRVWLPEEDAILLDKINIQGPSNWNEISAFVPERTAKQCRERWHNHLMGGFKKGDWTQEEDYILKSSHSYFGNQWSSISKHLPGRSVTDVKNRFNSLGKLEKRIESTTQFNSSTDSCDISTENVNHTKSDSYVKRVWTTEEDAVLIDCINMLGLVNWNVIASSLTGRTGKQCRERYHNHLRDGIIKGNWSNEEDFIILSSHARLGNHWSRIANLLSGRSSNDVKNRFKSITKNHNCNANQNIFSAYQNNYEEIEEEEEDEVEEEEEEVESIQSLVPNKMMNNTSKKRARSEYCNDSNNSVLSSFHYGMKRSDSDSSASINISQNESVLIDAEVEEGISCFRNFLQSLHR